MPKSKSISNLLKLAHVVCASNDPIHAPLGSPDVMSATPTLVVDNVSPQLPNQMQPVQQGVESSHGRTKVSSQLPNKTSSQPAQQGVRRSHRIANVSSQLPNQTVSQQRVKRSHRIANVSSQLPNQTSSQQGVKRSHRIANVSSQSPNQTSSQQGVKRSHRIANVSSQSPNQTSSQQGVRRSHRIANVSSQLPNQTSTQPTQQGVGSSHRRANVSSQLPSQTASQIAQKEAESSHCRVVNVSSQLPCQNSPQAVRPEHRDGRVSTHYWFVDAIDEEHGTIKKLRMISKDVKDMSNTLRIIVDFDEFHSPIGEAAGLLAGVCGLIATNSVFFPIGFDKWSNMPGSYFDEQWITFFLPRFCFKVHEDLAKRYIEASIGKKWREYRIKLWKASYRPTLSKREIINKKPKEIPPNHWALFVEYRLKPETMELCKRNQEIRKNQAFSHTCGAKSLARRRHELTIETGKTIGRGVMWNMIHKKKDGSYVNAKAMEIGQKIDTHINQNHEAASEISPNDVVANIFGRDHPGRVRAMGLGVVPTIAFKHTTTRLHGMEFGSSSGSNSLVEQKLAAVTAQLNAVIGYISAKEGGTLPKELAALFPNQTQKISDIGSECSSSDMRTLSDGSNIHGTYHQNPSNST
ncbi:uncharacterized protein LOC131632196 isoform X1 [Vicia villosa]|uniref:uncharacterized protein LOC131632196 isoform X1 n=1 Tax=Vicia villosa TaxID=3911 RepID=UPI00273C2671|nr:uncharacterized protein LOC131632196 isoform X1 [Vicia villosa]